MRKSMPLRWIEEQEARRVLASARYELVAMLVVPRESWGKWVRRWGAAGPSDPGSEAAAVADTAADAPGSSRATRLLWIVVPANAGIQGDRRRGCPWTPACAGVTGGFFRSSWITIQPPVQPTRRGAARDQRGDAGEPAEIVNELEAGLDLPVGETGERHQRAVFGVDIGPGDAQHARAFWRVDGAGEAASVAACGSSRSRPGGSARHPRAGGGPTRTLSISPWMTGSAIFAGVACAQENSRSATPAARK